MLLEPILAGYAGLAGLAMARNKHRPVPPLPLAPPPGLSRGGGVTMLALSFVLAMTNFGPTLGVVAWTGQLCLAGGGFVLLHSWKPRVAFALALPALGCALVF